MHWIEKLVGGIAVVAVVTTAAAAQEVDLALLIDTGAPVSGLTAIGDTLFVAGGGATVAARDVATGALDPAFGGDGLLGNAGGEHAFSAAIFVATDGVRLYVSDDVDNRVYVIDPTTGALDPSIGGDGIVGNDTGGPNPEPTLTNVNDVAVLAGRLFIADVGNGIDQYQLDGLGGVATTLTAAISPGFLAVGPPGAGAPCNLASPFAGNLLLYASDFNDDLRCVDSAATVQLLLDASSLAMRDHAFADPTGANCSALTPFSDGTVLYTAEANGGNEQRCTGSNGATFVSNDPDALGLVGLVRAADGHLYATHSGGTEIYESALALPVALESFTVE